MGYWNPRPFASPSIMISMNARLTMSISCLQSPYLKSCLFPPMITYSSARSAGTVQSSVRFDLGAVQPTGSLPHLPSNTKTVDEVAGLPIDQVVIGSCTNGRIDDMRIAAAILKGRKVADNVRCIVIPATQEVSLQCIREGLTEIFITAGCAVSTPTCGPCLGGHMGILSAGERAVATTNRNFVGRMGHTESEVILASPAVAAASAIAGCVASPVPYYGGENV